MKKFSLVIFLLMISCSVSNESGIQNTIVEQKVENKLPPFNGDCIYSLGEALDIVYGIVKDNNLQVKITWSETDMFNLDEKCEGKVVGSNLAQGAILENDSLLDLVVAVYNFDDSFDDSTNISEVQNTFNKTSGINLLFKNKFTFNENFNSISDIDKIEIEDKSYYLITMTYSANIILVDDNFNFVDNILDFSDIVLSSNTGSESGLINIEIIKKDNSLYTLFISYVDKKSRLTLSQFELNENLDLLSNNIIFQGNQNRKPEHYGGSILNEENKFLYLSIGDHSIVDKTLANNFTPESKILKFSINQNNSEISLKPSGINFDPIYNLRNDVNASSLDSIFLSGFRNPWNFSILNKPNTDEKIYVIGDVGQSKYEEINIVKEQEDLSSLYFGWPFYEGPFLSPYFNDVSDAIKESHRVPDFYYEHKENDTGGFRCAIILGGEYSSKYDYQNGVFLFTDWCSSEIFSLKITPNGNEFFVYEDVQILNYESNTINPNLLKTIGEKTFLLTVKGEVFELVDK